MNKDIRKLKIMMFAMLTVFIGVLVFFLLAFKKEDLNAQNYIWMGLVLIVLLFSIGIFLSRLRDINKGLPLEDERSKKVLNLASSRAFYVSLYWLLAISIFEKPLAGLAGLENFDAGQTVGGGILGMALAFMGLWFYYNHKANI